MIFRTAISVTWLPRAKWCRLKENVHSPFRKDVLDYMVKVFVEYGDRENLVKELSTRFPAYIHEEYYWSDAWWFGKEGVKDPVLVLGEAYARCKIPKVRREIASAVRRGFIPSGVTGEHDAEFVDNAMRWYKKEKDHLDVDEYYPVDRVLPEVHV